MGGQLSENAHLHPLPFPEKDLKQALNRCANMALPEVSRLNLIVFHNGDCQSLSCNLFIVE